MGCYHLKRGDSIYCDYCISNPTYFKNRNGGHINYRICPVCLENKVKNKGISGHKNKYCSYRCEIRAKKNIEYHYDIGNSFYEIWLDKSMTYSSALFKNDKEDLYEAQRNKYQTLVEQLDIKPSMIQPIKDIKTIGKFDVKISLHSEIDAEIIIDVQTSENIQ